MNLSRIENENFQKEIKDFWREWKNEKGNYEDVGLWWDIGKTYIKRIAIEFSIKKQKENCAKKKKAKEDLRLEREQPQQDRGRITELIAKLTEIELEKQRKIFISTHNEVIEPGERPSKYFFNQVKSKQTKNGMSTLKNEEGILLTEQGSILKETVSFCTNLYTADEELDKKEQENFIENIHRTLPEKDKNELEKELTEKELEEALKQAENEKTLGCDGIPYEFYKSFWTVLGEDLYQAMVHNLNNKKALTVSQRTSIIALLFKGKDKNLLKNWRPISLLCTDYKILSKALANRMKAKQG